PVDSGLARHQAAVDEVPAQCRDVRVEEGQAHVDLLLLVVAILRKALVEDQVQEQLSLARLGRDRDEAPVAYERTDHLFAIGQLAQPGAVLHRPTVPEWRPLRWRGCCPTDDASAPTSRSARAWSRRPTGRPRSARRPFRSSAT